MKNLIKVVFIALIGLTLFSCEKEEQLPGNMIKYTTKDGLFNNTVHSIVIDGQGNPLVSCGLATSYYKYEAGLCHFDGNKWVTYQEKDGWAKNWILSMAMDQQGTCWIGTHEGGVIKFDGSHFTTVTDADGLIEDGVLSIAIDQQGNPWFGTYRALVYLESEHWKTYRTKQVLSILPDTLGNIWFGTAEAGLWKLDKEENLSHYIIKGRENDGFVKDIAIDARGNKWCCTNGVGVSQFDGTKWINYTTDDGLPSIGVSCVAADQQGNIWVGTDNGIARFDGTAWTSYLAGYHVLSIACDAMGNKWIGTYGKGLIKLKN